MIKQQGISFLKVYDNIYCVNQTYRYTTGILCKDLKFQPIKKYRYLYQIQALCQVTWKWFHENDEHKLYSYKYSTKIYNHIIQPVNDHTKLLESTPIFTLTMNDDPLFE